VRIPVEYGLFEVIAREFGHRGLSHVEGTQGDTRAKGSCCDRERGTIIMTRSAEELLTVSYNPHAAASKDYSRRDRRSFATVS